MFYNIEADLRLRDRLKQGQIVYLPEVLENISEVPQEPVYKTTRGLIVSAQEDQLYPIVISLDRDKPFNLGPMSPASLFTSEEVGIIIGDNLGADGLDIGLAINDNEINERLATRMMAETAIRLTT